MSEAPRPSHDTQLRGLIYRSATTSGVVPSVAALAEWSAIDQSDVRASLARLAEGRVVVLQPSSGEILMAPPFSAVPTPFLVEAGSLRTYANCIWDALGVPIMLRREARIVTSCGCCGERIVLDVSPKEPPGGPGLVHFAIPAAKWWNDIVFT